MKKYIHLLVSKYQVKDNHQGSLRYFEKSFPKERWLLAFLISEIDFNKVLKLVEGPIGNDGFYSEWLDVEWSRKYNGVVVRLRDFYKVEENKDDFYVMKFDNFKKMMEGWDRLRKKRATNIYFVEQASGRITVQESLEEEPPYDSKANKEMQFFKIVTNDHSDYSVWQRDPALLSVLKILFFIIKDIKPEDFLENFEKVNGKLEFRFANVHWSQSHNSVVLYSGGDERDFYTLKFDNFKTMIEDWKKLRDEKVPAIYFIQENDGTIVVREDLEGQAS